jgi:hypothetical protein
VKSVAFLLFFGNAANDGGAPRTVWFSAQKQGIDLGLNWHIMIFPKLMHG